MRKIEEARQERAAERRHEQDEQEETSLVREFASAGVIMAPEAGARQLTPEEALANAELIRSRARYAEAAAAALEARLPYITMESREKAAAAERMALVHERQVATIMGEDDYRFVYQFTNEVTKGTVEKAMIHLNWWHAMDQTADWEIHFDTPGGAMHAGFRFFDYLSLYRQTHKITTVVMGGAHSMGAILSQGGTVRRMGREASLMLHKAELAGWVEGKIDDVEIELAFIHAKHDRIIRIFVDRAQEAAKRQPSVCTEPVTAEFISERWKHANWYMDSDEALMRGLVDQVI